MSFSPFQPVLVRTGREPWRPAYYGYCIDNYHHVTTGGQIVAEVTPFEGHEHLVGSIDGTQAVASQPAPEPHHASSRRGYEPPEGSELAEVVSSEINADKTVGNPGWRGFQIVLSCRRQCGETVRAWEILDIEGRKSPSLQDKARKVWRVLTGSDAPATLPAAATLVSEIRIPKHVWLRPKDCSNGKTYWNVTRWGD